MGTHWKKLTNPNYLGSWDFEEKEERVLTIKEVKQETVKDQNGHDDQVVTMYFTKGLPMILNKTNLKATEKATGSGEIENWIGKQVTLYTANIRAFGEQVNALRISPSAPKPKAKPKLDEERFKGALAAVEMGTYTADQLKAQYALTKKQIEMLNQ